MEVSVYEEKERKRGDCVHKAREETVRVCMCVCVWNL